jgi:hypothetical protein
MQNIPPYSIYSRGYFWIFTYIGYLIEFQVPEAILTDVWPMQWKVCEIPK